MATDLLTQSNLRQLFDNYNNINQEVATQLADFLASLAGGGTSGNFTVNGDLFISGQIKGFGTNIRSIDTNNRYVADSSGVIRYNWTTGLFNDSLNKKSVDTEARRLYESDGTTVALDWSSGFIFSSISLPQNTGILSLGNSNTLFEGVNNWNEGGVGVGDTNTLVSYNSQGHTVFYVNGNSNDAGFAFQSAPNGQATVFTNMYITNLGKVGIGQNLVAPSAILHLQGIIGAATVFKVEDHTASEIFSISDAGDINVDGVPGVSGTFTSADAKTVTVTKGIITSIV